jgi:hypothetical protein
MIQVWLQNLLSTPINIDPMGNAWNIDTMLQPVQPGMVASYNLLIPATAAPPSSSAQSSWMYLYRSSVNPTQHENGGLVGPIIVTRKGEALPDGRPHGVDKEIIIVFQVREDEAADFCLDQGGQCCKAFILQFYTLSCRSVTEINPTQIIHHTYFL